MRVSALVIAGLLMFVACSSSPRSENDGLSVLVSVVPQKYIVERLTSDDVTVTVLVPPGASPASYELSPSDMQAVSGADVWFSIGVPVEQRWLNDFPELNPELLIVDVTEDIERLPMAVHHHHGDEQHDHDSLEDGPMDPHVWLSPELVKVQAASMAEALQELDAVNAEIYRDSLEQFLAGIEELQREMRVLLDPVSGGSFMVFHPAWGYFAHEFDLEQIPIESGGNEPSPEELAHLITEAREKQVTVIFVSPQFSQSSAETIANEAGAGVAVLDPLAENWEENMLAVARVVSEASR